MNDFVTPFREAGSFVAGLLIGLAIAVPVSAMSMTQPNDWQILWVLCGAAILALGIILQRLVTAKPARRPMAAELRVLAARFIGLSPSA